VAADRFAAPRFARRELERDPEKRTPL